MSRFDSIVRSWSAISRSLPQFAPARRPHARRRLTRPTLMALEDRRLLSTIVVNNPTDTPVTGEIDLRQAIVQANTTGGDQTITFDQTVFTTPQTITLDPTLGQLELSDTTGTETITGPNAGVTVNGGGNSRVFLVDPNVTASISGMTITGGIAGSGTSRDGGGVDNFGTLTVSNCVFSSNSADFGGGIDNSGTLTVSNCVFSSNTSALGLGGGIENEISGTATVSDSTFTGNSAAGGGGLCNFGAATVSGSTFTSNSATGGGGILNATGGTATVSGSTFTSNFAGNNGGGIANDSGVAMTVNACTFTSNFTYIAGGGLSNFGAATVSDSTFTANSAGSGGGLANGGNSGTATVINSVFTNNSAVGFDGGLGYGGGLSNNSTVTVINSTFIGNSAINGGGLDNYNSSTATVTNCTVSGNTSQGAGGGIANGVDDGSLTLDNTIVAGNTSPSDNDISGPIESTSAFNLIGDGSGISNLTDLEAPALSNLIGTTSEPLNPLLGLLGDYGGPTQTMALLPGSPAIDAGSNALIPAGVTTDQRGPGFPRIVNGTVDIGAFESQGFTLTPVTGSTPQGTPVNSPFANPLAVIVTANNPLEPVAGGIVTFSAPASGASAGLSTTGPVTIGSNGQASVTATANAIGGQYTVSASTAGAAAPVSFVLTNQFLSQTISFGPLADQTYGVAPITLNATASSDLPVSFTVLSGPATLSGNVLTVTGAGTVDVEASQLGNATYAAAVPVDESFTVNPAPLIVTAMGESMTYGGTVPALNYTYAGLVNGDSSATFSGGLATTATSSSSVGGYAITQGSLVATGNYTIGTFNGATLTINKAGTGTMVVSSANPSVYGQAVTFTATVTNTSSGSTAVPTGTVQFVVDGSNFGAPVAVNATGLALSLPDTFLSGASHTVKAVYTNIDGNFLGNNSTNLTQTVQTVAVEPDPSNPTLTDLFIGSNGATSNDTILVNPVGSSNTGSTGVTVQTTLNGVTVKTTYSQSFSTIYAFLQNGSENVQLANTLTINTVVTAGNGNDNVQLGNGNNVVTLGNGNDNIQAGSGSNTVMAGNGNDNIQAGSGSNTVMAGNGNDNVQAGSGSNTVMAGNGNDNVSAGNGSDVIVEGNGSDNVSAGNGSDLVVGGLGQHTIQLGNGNDILIDGSATVVNSGDSLRQIVSDWNASSSASVDTRLKVVYNTSHPNVLKAGGGRDWFFYTYSKDVTNKKATDRLN